MKNYKHLRVLTLVLVRLVQKVRVYGRQKSLYLLGEKILNIKKNYCSF